MTLTGTAAAATTTATAITEVTTGGYYGEEVVVGDGITGLVGLVCTSNLTFGEENVAPVHKFTSIVELGLSQVARTHTPPAISTATYFRYPRLGKHYME